MLPKRRFWKTKQPVGRVFSSDLRTFVAQIEYSHPRKVPRKDTPDPLFRFPKIFVWEAYIWSNRQKCMHPKRRFWENETAGRACRFEAFCEGSSLKSSTHTLAKCLETTRPTRCFVFPKSSFGMHKVSTTWVSGTHTTAVDQSQCLRLWKGTVGFSLNGISIGAHLRILMVIQCPCVIAGKYHLEREPTVSRNDVPQSFSRLTSSFGRAIVMVYSRLFLHGIFQQ